MGKTNSDARDVYYRKAKEEGYRARSAYKLMHCDEKYNLFQDVDTVVDLCAAPGSWSQVCANKLKEYIKHDDLEKVNNSSNFFEFPNGKELVNNDGKYNYRKHRVVSVDLQPMSPIHGVHMLKGDITEDETIKRIIAALGGKKAGLVICDGAPDVTGFHNFDEFMQGQLLYAAFSTAYNVLLPGGSFISKIFKAQQINLILTQMTLFFNFVDCYKPPSSRPDSCEHFLICKGFKPIEGFTPCLKNPILSRNYEKTLASYTPLQRKYVPLLACGDLSGWNKDEAKEAGLLRALSLNENEYDEIFDRGHKTKPQFIVNILNIIFRCSLNNATENEEETDAVVNQVLDELGIDIADELRQMPSSDQPLTTGTAKKQTPVAADGAVNDADADLQARLEMLRKN